MIPPSLSIKMELSRKGGSPAEDLRLKLREIFNPTHEPIAMHEYKHEGVT